MGCFIACLRSSGDVKRRKHRRRKVLPPDQGNAISKPVQASPSAVNSASDRSISPILKARDRHDEEQQLSPSTRKRVTFDSNVKTYELDHVEAEVLFDKEKNVKELAELPQCKSHSDDGSTVSSLSSYPPNHRYQNCRESDDEDELDYADTDPGDTDGDCDEKDYDDIEYKEYNDYFSDDESGISSVEVFADEVDSCLSVCGCPVKTESQIGVTWTSRDSNDRVPSVLKPVENISQWKAVKVKDKHRQNPPPRKGNSTLNEAPECCFGTEPSCKEPSFGYKSIAVDASLSNWLSSSEVTSPSKSSTGISSLPTPKIQKDNPILGALTMEEISSPSPRRSPNRRLDEMPIIGTVGMHWRSHSGSVEDFVPAASPFERMTNTSSNYREMHVK